MKIKNNDKKIEEFLSRWTDKIYPSKEEFLKVLSSRKLVIYHGVDPTAPDLHLGHSTNYLLLKKFQEMGHKIILLIGDFTAQIGDPTGKLSSRQSLTKAQVLKNCNTYKEQVGKILDFNSKKNPIILKFNSKWLEKMNLAHVLKLAGTFTYGKMIKRKMFQERLKKNQEIFLPEFIYPLLQGYDSVAMDVDVEIGGTDQTFNMLVGRDLMKIYKNKEKFVVTTPLLENPKTGKKLMSKSEGNYIALGDKSGEMFGRTMALPDEVIISCFTLCTEVSLNEINKMEKGLKSKKINPRDLKAKLAKEIISIYHGEKKALSAEKEFDKVFKEKKAPTKIPEAKISEKEIKKVFPLYKKDDKSGSYHIYLLDLISIYFSLSKTEAKRLIEKQNAVKINNVIKNDYKELIEVKTGMVIQVGKRRFIKLK